MTDEERIAHDIISYLTEKPSAKDTFEGIAEWWLLQQQINQAVEKVNKVLESLVAKGFVSIKQYSGQDKFYQVNKAKIAEMQSYLAGLEQKK